MRIIIGLFALMILAVGCGEETPTGDQMLLTGTVKGLKKGTLILQRLQDTTLVSIDSVVVDGDANFKIMTSVDSPQLYFLYLRLNTGTLIDERVPFFAEPGTINLSTSLKGFGSNANINGSKNQDQLNQYNKLVSRYTNRNLDLIESMFKARQERNDSLFDVLQKEQTKLLASKYLATVNFAFNNKELEVAPYLMLSEVYDANIKYLDTVYKALAPAVQSSKYGKELAALIDARK